MRLFGRRTKDRAAEFTPLAGAYARWRPGYPTELIDALLEGVDLSAARVADIGAGTNGLALSVAERLSGSGRVLAVEPNDAMRLVAARHGRIEQIAARAEATTIADASVDVVACAQAFHLLDGAAALAEFRRIARRGGRVAVIMNLHDHGPGLGGAFWESMDAHCGRRTGLPEPDHALRTAGWQGPLRVERWRHSVMMDVESTIGLARSYARYPADEAERRRLDADLARAHRQHAGSDGLAAMGHVAAMAWFATE